MQLYSPTLVHVQPEELELLEEEPPLEEEELELLEEVVEVEQVTLEGEQLLFIQHSRKEPS